MKKNGEIRNAALIALVIFFVVVIVLIGLFGFLRYGKGFFNLIPSLNVTPEKSADIQIIRYVIGTNTVQYYTGSEWRDFDKEGDKYYATFKDKKVEAASTLSSFASYFTPSLEKEITLSDGRKVTIEEVGAGALFATEGDNFYAYTFNDFLTKGTAKDVSNEEPLKFSYSSANTDTNFIMIFDSSDIEYSSLVSTQQKNDLSQLNLLPVRIDSSGALKCSSKMPSIAGYTFELQSISPEQRKEWGDYGGCRTMHIDLWKMFYTVGGVKRDTGITVQVYVSGGEKLVPVKIYAVKVFVYGKRLFVNGNLASFADRGLGTNINDEVLKKPLRESFDTILQKPITLSYKKLSPGENGKLAESDASGSYCVKRIGWDLVVDFNNPAGGDKCPIDVK